MKLMYAALAAAAAAAGIARAGETVAGITITNQVVTFNSDAPGTLLSTRPITGLMANDRVLGLDFRPLTNEVIAIGESNFLYSLDIASGMATPIGSGFSPGLDGSPFTRYGIDINPTVDRVRVVGANAANRRLNPVTGGAVAPAADTNLSYNPPIGFGLPPRAVAVAYTNSIANAPMGSTREFILDSLNNVLGEVGSQVGGNASFNGGVIASTFAVQLNGATLDFDDNAGLDVSGATGIAYASLNLQNTPGALTGLYQINLANGQAMALGSVGGDLIRDITVVPAPGAGAVIGLAALLGLRRRR